MSGIERRAMVCAWCNLPRSGKECCICDSPKFVEMEPCAKCGEWTDVDRLFGDWDEDLRCHDCFTAFDYSEGQK